MTDAELKSLKKQRTSNKNKLITINKYQREKVDINTPLENVKARLARVEQLMSEFTTIEAHIFALSDTEQPDDSYEEEYYSAIAGLNSWIRKLSLQEGQSFGHHNSATTVGDTSEVKLPKLRIPKFKGDITEWQTFYDMFMSTIHNSTRLSPVEKFQHLKLALEGEAAFLLRHVAVTETNYIGALNKLKVRYDRKRHAINAFIKTFVDQPSFSHGSVGALKKFMDTSDDVIRGLKALGEIAETRDPWLIYLLSQKMDDKSKAAWAEYSVDMEEPKITDFLAFLQRRIDTLESVTTVVLRKSNTEARGHVAIHKTDHNMTSAADTRNKTSSSHCTLCSSKDHCLLNCDRFVSMDVTKRLEYVKENRRCYNCLSQNHSVTICPVLARCKKCRRKHHTLLHIMNGPQEVNPSSAIPPDGSSGNADKDQPVSAHCCSKLVSTCAILPTAIAKVTTKRGDFRKCRILLDSGSQLSFITEACANNLGLSRKTSDVQISGLGHSQAQTTNGIVSLRIKGDKFKIWKLIYWNKLLHTYPIISCIYHL